MKINSTLILSLFLIITTSCLSSQGFDSVSYHSIENCYTWLKDSLEVTEYNIDNQNLLSITIDASIPQTISLVDKDSSILYYSGNKPKNYHFIKLESIDYPTSRSISIYFRESKRYIELVPEYSSYKHCSIAYSVRQDAIYIVWSKVKFSRW
jgi:hypothetical protein